MNFDDYLHLKSQTVKDLDEAYEKANKTEQSLLEIRLITGEEINKIQTDKEKIGKIRSVISQFPEEAEYIPMDEIATVLPSGSSMAGLIKTHYQQEYETIEQSAINFVQIQNSTTVSASMTSAMDVIVLTMGQSIGERYLPMKRTLKHVITRLMNAAGLILKT